MTSSHPSAAHPARRLDAPGAPDELLHRIRLPGPTGPARWQDPYWPDHRYSSAQ
ncbi:hypothetical protein ACIPJN_03815 [Streptomyces sp. NPDC086796]|uniref:hypothetical protein n=1 Tax=unclassified Streptomyces TaxID=2593676 RepID=UPI00339716F5